MNGDDPMSLMIRQAIRRFLVGEDGIAGSALVEFSIFAPLLVVVSIYTMDFSLLFYRQMQVQNGRRRVSTGLWQITSLMLWGSVRR